MTALHDSCITIMALASYTLAAVVAVAVCAAAVQWVIARLATPVVRALVKGNRL